MTVRRLWLDRHTCHQAVIYKSLRNSFLSLSHYSLVEEIVSRIRARTHAGTHARTLTLTNLHLHFLEEHKVNIIITKIMIVFL
jgi:hypothetical protein